jgi:prepilin-type N-terminal cleavage/methylation domain-containing protein
MNTEIETKAKKDEKGFTLVELLIVIVILGILSTIVVFSVRGLTGKANSNSCKIDARSLQTAIEGYYATNANTYPPANSAAAPTAFQDALADPDGDPATADGYMDKVSSNWDYSVTATGFALAPSASSSCTTDDLP